MSDTPYLASEVVFAEQAIRSASAGQLDELLSDIHTLNDDADTPVRSKYGVVFLLATFYTCLRLKRYDSAKDALRLLTKDACPVDITSLSNLLAIFDASHAGRAANVLPPTVVTLECNANHAGSGKVLAFPGFENANLEGWQWPSVEAPRGDGEIEAMFGRGVGPLKLVGYSVSASDGIENPPTRRRLLAAVVELDFPESWDGILSDKDRADWGAPNTMSRLAKMADSLAAFCRNAKRRKADMSIPIGRWEKDLLFLKTVYYDVWIQRNPSQTHYAWPSTWVRN